ncbi:MAG: AI-2E family transporter [Bacilli bacterium]
MDLKCMKRIMIIVAFGVILFWGLNNLGTIGHFLLKVWKLFTPFVIGAVIAFILNLPCTKIENFLKKHIKKYNKSLIRAISIVLSLVIFLAIIVLICFLLIPELIENIELLIDVIPGFIKDKEEWAVSLLESYPELQDKIIETFSDSTTINSIMVTVLNYFVNSFFNIITGIVSGIVTFVTAIVFAIYALSQKEYLARGFKKILYAYTKKEVADKVIEIADLANRTFTNFISGQCFEAIILGCIFFVVMTIMKLPYALIISVLISFTALIPMFGAMIAACVGAILIAVINPVQALLFIIVFLIIQQIENNFIYPKVVGNSVGLSAMWTLIAVMVGGSLMGITGMIIGLPLASIIYAILRSETNNIINKKKIKL